MHSVVREPGTVFDDSAVAKLPVAPVDEPGEHQTDDAENLQPVIRPEHDVRVLVVRTLLTAMRTAARSTRQAGRGTW